MKNIKENCDAIQEHIRKADKYLTRFMYINSTMEYVIMLPIIHLHKKHFKEVANNIDNIKKYAKLSNLKINIESFEEHTNSAVFYNKSQMGSLTSKQFELRSKYLKDLDNKIEEVKKHIT